MYDLNHCIYSMLYTVYIAWNTLGVKFTKAEQSWLTTCNVTVAQHAGMKTLKHTVIL